MTTNQIKVFMVDDHPIVHEGIDHFLVSEQEFDMVGHSQSAEEALSKIRNCHPDVILLDISLPGMNGLELIPRLKKVAPKVEVVIFSMHNKEALIQQAFKLGALGYVLKGSSREQITAAIRAAYGGEHFLSSQIEANVINNFLQSCKNKKPVSKYDELTEREQEVFRLMVEGKSTAEIANVLCITTKTAEKHRGNVMKKLNVHELVGLVKYAIEIGIIDPYSWKS